ncbi:hypothetical protein HDU93_007416 [Gonapodya sp. JEL0774]|nr:hypothetical protein HDU93_007416 [Gonapodya sp. JEL0774]
MADTAGVPSTELPMTAPAPALSAATTATPSQPKEGEGPADATTATANAPTMAAGVSRKRERSPVPSVANKMLKTESGVGAVVTGVSGASEASNGTGSAVPGATGATGVTGATPTTSSIATTSNPQPQPAQPAQKPPPPPPPRKRLDGEPPLIVDDPALSHLPDGVVEKFLASENRAAAGTTEESMAINARFASSADLFLKAENTALGARSSGVVWVDFGGGVMLVCLYAAWTSPDEGDTDSSRKTQKERRLVDQLSGSLPYQPPTYPRPSLPTTVSVRLRPLPLFASADLYGIVEIRVPLEEISVTNLAVRKRAVWGTGVYTDDSDVVGALIHSGWIRPLDAPPIVSPPDNFTTSGYILPGDPVSPNFSSASSSDAFASASSTSKPTNKAPFPGPPPLPLPLPAPHLTYSHTLLARLRILPKLTRYTGTVRNGLRSRSWGGSHLGESFRIEGVEIVEGGRRAGRKGIVKKGEMEGVVVLVGEGVVSFKYDPSLLVSWPPHVYRAMWQQMDDAGKTDDSSSFETTRAPNPTLYPSSSHPGSAISSTSNSPADPAAVDDLRLKTWQAGWDELSGMYKGVPLPRLWSEGWEGWRVRMEVEVLYMDVVEGKNRSRYELSLQTAVTTPTRPTPAPLAARYRLALLDPSAFPSWDDPLPACPVPGSHEGIRGKKVVLGVLARDLEGGDLGFVGMGLVVRGGGRYGEEGAEGDVVPRQEGDGGSGNGSEVDGAAVPSMGGGKPPLYPVKGLSSGAGPASAASPGVQQGLSVVQSQGQVVSQHKRSASAVVGGARRKVGINGGIGALGGGEAWGLSRCGLLARRSHIKPKTEIRNSLAMASMSTATGSTTQTALESAPPATAAPGWRVSDQEIADFERRFAEGPQTVFLAEAQLEICPDISGSTAGTCLQVEKLAAKAIAGRNTRAGVVPWHSTTLPRIPITDVDTLRAMGGTSPQYLLKQNESLQFIKASNVWALFTDGEIGVADVNELASLVASENMGHLPVIVAVFGPGRETPSATNISVGISLFAACEHVLFLYQRVDIALPEPYILQSKGCFAALGTVATLDSTISWTDLPRISWEAVSATELPITHAGMPGVTRLSPTLTIRVAQLLETHLPTETLLEIISDEEVLRNLILLCTTRGLGARLRTWLGSHMMDAAEVVKPEDVAGAAVAMQRLMAARERNAPVQELLSLQAALRSAHATNDAHYRTQYETLARARTSEIRRINSAINAAMAQLGETERAGYSAEVLGTRLSNRAMRATKVTESDTVDNLMRIVEGDVEDATAAFRGDCTICCEQNVLLSLTMKRVLPENTEVNTADFALDFPLAVGSRTHNDIIASQVVCSGCADQVVSTYGTTLFRENATITIPLASIKDNTNRDILSTRLAIALTNGLKTGNVFQLMISVLDNTLSTKLWARVEPGSDDAENRVRRAALEWFRDDLATHVRTKNNFQETGEWTTLPFAIQWAVEDAVTNGYRAWLYRYPVEGFAVLIKLARNPKFAVTMPLDGGVNFVHKRLLLGIVDWYMRETLKGADQQINARTTIWRALYGELRYGKPVEGCGRIIKTFGELDFHKTFEGPHYSRLLTEVYGLGESGNVAGTRFPFPAATSMFLRRLLEINRHDSITNAVQTVRTNDPECVNAIDFPNLVSDETAINTIEEMFFHPELPPQSSLDVINRHVRHSPKFVTPYGPSILGCDCCGARFAPPGTQGTPEELAAVIRTGRAEHFRSVYGATSSSGLPIKIVERNGRLTAPSAHWNGGRVVTRQWVKLSQEAQQEYLAGTGNVDAFVEEAMRYIVQEDEKGNIYSSAMKEDLETMFRSFLSVVRVHGFENNGDNFSVPWKLGMELGKQKEQIAKDIVQGARWTLP